MLYHCLHWDIAALLLENEGGLGEPVQIRVSKMKYDEVGGDRFLVSGEDKTFDAELHTICVRPSREHVPQPEGEVDWETGVLPRAVNAARRFSHAVLDRVDKAIFGDAALDFIGEEERAEIDAVLPDGSDSDSDPSSSSSHAAPAAGSEPPAPATPPAPPPPPHGTLAARLADLQDVHEARELMAALPEYHLSDSWAVQRLVPGSQPVTLAQLHLAGQSIVARCKIHKTDCQKCSAHIVFASRVAVAECLCVKWAIAGEDMSFEQHQSEVHRLRRGAAHCLKDKI